MDDLGVPLFLETPIFVDTKLPTSNLYLSHQPTEPINNDRSLPTLEKFQQSAWHDWSTNPPPKRHVVGCPVGSAGKWLGSMGYFTYL